MVQATTSKPETKIKSLSSVLKQNVRDGNVNKALFQVTVVEQLESYHECLSINTLNKIHFSALSGCFSV